MMARLGNEDGSSSSSVAHGSDDGTPVTHKHAIHGAAVLPLTGAATEAEMPSSQTSQDRVIQDQRTTTSPSSSLDSLNGRARTSSLCSSGRESSSGGEQLAQAVKGSNLTFTSSSSSSSLCSDDGSGAGHAETMKKLETLPEETVAPVVLSTTVEGGRKTNMDGAKEEPPTGCQTQEIPKQHQYFSSESTSITLNVPRQGIAYANNAPISEGPSGEASTVRGPELPTSGVSIAPGSGHTAVEGTLWNELTHSNKLSPRSSGIPSMLARTTPRDGVVPHGFVTAKTTSSLVQPPQVPSQPTASAPLRRGKWTVEEEAYVARVIKDFNSGYLNAPAGTTLRSYLSEKLHCDPMRITKKFTGAACIGKRVFHPAVRCAGNATAIDKAQAELDALEQRWRRRLEMQQRESAKKAAASAAAAAASCGRASNLHVPVVQPGLSPAVPGSTTKVSTSSVGTQDNVMKQNVVARTASWLDRATAVLSSGSGTALDPHSATSETLVVSEDHRIEDQLKEVRRLIHEGPVIQQTTAGLPNLLHPNDGVSHNIATGLASELNTAKERTGGAGASSIRGLQQPVDKRPRRSSADQTSGAEDAEALVGFLNSVRAAASSES